MKLTGAAILVSCGMKDLLAAPAAYPYRSARGGLSVVTVDGIEAWLGRRLPETYRTFLAGKLEDFLAANDRTLVYGPSSVVERNETFESKRYCPGFLAVADDSSGSALVLSLADGSICSVGIGAMTPDCFEPVAASFAEWQAAGFRYVE
jgi:hypothetical protein